jgi:putative ABC transport system ATP-binding protein
MQITLQKILPIFFNASDVSASQVWNQQVAFEEAANTHIIAPSGSGKTSLIHFLYGLRNDFTGEIKYDGISIKDFDKEKKASLRQQTISIVFQDLRLFPNQTVYENIAIKRLLSPFHAADQIAAMASRLGIQNKLQQLCGTCSYGEQQRIAIIRALQQPFQYLLLDEPFSNLDETNRQKAMQLIQEEATVRKAYIILADLKKIDYFKADSILHL